MMRTIGISLVGVIMAVQLLFLFARHIQAYEMRDYPRMALPVAKNAHRYCSGGYIENISWTQKGGWVVSGIGPVRDQDLDQVLSGAVQRSLENGLTPGLRVRIPANAPAGIFVNLTKRMERSGVLNVRVAVVDRRLASL